MLRTLFGHVNLWIFALAFLTLLQQHQLMAQDSSADSSSGAVKSGGKGLLEPVSRDYPVAAVLARIQKEGGLNEQNAERWLTDRLNRRLINSEIPSAEGSMGSVGEIELNLAGRGCKVTASTATVICEADKHPEVAAYIRTLKEFGLRQVLIRTKIMKGPSDVVLNRLPIDWEHVPTSSPFARDLEDTSKNQVRAGGSMEKSQPDNQQSPVVLAAHHELASIKENNTETPRNAERGEFAEAYSFVERANPVFFSLTSPDQAQAFENAASLESDIDLVMSPSVVVYDGQEGTVGNGVQRPFVVGIEPKMDDNAANRTVTFQPKVKVYSEGINLRLRPEPIGNSIRLGCDLDIREIRNVETFKMPRFDGAGVFQVQIPEVATTQFRTTRSLPKDFTMVVATLQSDKDGKREALLVMCQCVSLTLSDDEE